MAVDATVEPTETGWLLVMKEAPDRSRPSGDHRLQDAVQTICELDTLTRRAIKRGRQILREIPSKPSGPPPFSAAEMVIPLLTSTERKRLYPFQEEGVRWLSENPRAILGDDMGLGKTAQALCATYEMVRDGRVRWGIVVAPRTLVANWLKEARTWAPELAVGPMLETGAHREPAWQRLVSRAHLIVTSYEQLRDPPAALVGAPFDLLIADEAHRLRKLESLVTQGVRSLEPERFWALTGTPLERDARDVAVLMSLLEPQRFAADDGADHPMTLRARVRPYTLRRRKEDVLKQLPEVFEETEVLELTANQRAAYEERIRVYTRTGGVFLALFNELRQICDLDPRTGASSKIDRIVDILSDLMSTGEKAVVFSYLLDPLFALSGRLSQDDVQIDHELLTGGMGLDAREAAVKRFMGDAKSTALLASTRVGSEGLTLTAASHVIFVNRWWNPSANRQARDRVVRIGQERVVQVRSFTCKGTVEERLEVLLEEKSISFHELIDQLSVDPGLEADLLTSD